MKWRFWHCNGFNIKSFRWLKRLWCKKSYVVRPRFGLLNLTTILKDRRGSLDAYCTENLMLIIDLRHNIAFVLRLATGIKPTQEQWLNTGHVTHTVKIFYMQIQISQLRKPLIFFFEKIIDFFWSVSYQFCR